MADAPTGKRTSSGERSKGPLVLLVEDDADLRGLFAEILTKDGFRVIESYDGHAAVVKALGYLPAVVVMDVSLPLMDGARAARVLRSNPRTKNVRLIAFTGKALDARDRKSFDAVVEKPCTPDVLVAAVRTILASKTRRSAR